MAKHDDIIGKKLLEVEEKPERLTLFFEDNWYLIIYKKNKEAPILISGYSKDGI